MEDTIKRGRGRPVEPDARRYSAMMRFDDEEEAMLNYLTSKNGETKSAVIRKALRGYYAYCREVNVVDKRKR